MERRQEIMSVQTRLGLQEIDAEKILFFPRGLIGFEDLRSFTLLQLREGAPFLILQSLERPDLGLLVGDPYTFLPDYCIKVGDAEQALLHVTSANQLVVLVTVSIPHGKPENTTLNLTGPVLINHEARIGLQVPQADFEGHSRVMVCLTNLEAPAETPTAAAETLAAQKTPAKHQKTIPHPTAEPVSDVVVRKKKA